MDINIAVQQFQQLVNEFINHKDFSKEGNKIFKQKQKMLITFSQTITSLGVCLAALEFSDDQPTIYFASQFVKDKLKYQFQQLTKPAIVQTHTSVINIIRTRTNLTKIVTSNLALCLCFVYIHCHEQLGTALAFINNTFAPGQKLPNNASLYYQYLFKYLDGLACEIDSKRLVIDYLKRAEVQKALKSQQVQVVMKLHTIYHELSSKDSQIKLSLTDLQNILYSFSEWIRIDVPPREIVDEIHDHSVLKLALSSLSDPQLSEPAAECLLAVMDIVKNPQENPNFFNFMGNNLEYFFKCIDKKIQQEQFDEAENYVKVLCEYGQSAGDVFIQNFNQNSQLFIQKMIKYTEDPMMEVYKQLVDFWQSMIYFISTKTERNILDKATAHRIIGALYLTFTAKIRYNSTQVHELDQMSERQLSKLHQSIEDVRDRREFARQIFGAIAKFLGYEAYVTEVLNICKSLDQNDDNYWGKIESYIYSLRDAVEYCVQPTPDICHLVLFFQNIKQKHIIVMKSILRVYTSFQSMQVKNEEFILRILVHLTSMFEEPLLNDKAGAAFTKCCQQNASILVKHLSSLYELLKRYPDRDSILVGLTHILKAYPNLLSTNLPQIIKGPLQRLKVAQSKKEKRDQFNKLFTIIECVPKGETKNISEIIQLLLKEMWPIVSQILQQPQEVNSDQDRLIERAVKFLKLVMRSIPQEFIKYLAEIFNVVKSAYKKFPINSYVYLFEVTFTVYYKSPEAQLINFLKTLYQQYCQITYQHLNSEEALVNYQHLVDDFIGLNKRIVTYHTRMFLESGQVKPILEFSTHCLGSIIPRIASSSSQLFEIIFMIYWTPYSRQQYQNEDKGEVVEIDNKNVALYGQLKKFILPLIQNILRKMFKFLETGPLQSARSNIIDCLEAIALAFPNEGTELWTQPLIELAEDIMTNKEKERLKQNITKLGSENHLEFINAHQVVNKLLVTISSRFLYRQSRAENLNSM